MSESLEVWLDCDLCPMQRLGTLAHDRGPRPFDFNPSIDKATHVLNIDDVNNRPSLETLLATAAFYRLTAKSAGAILGEVVKVVAGWKSAARRARIATAEIELSTSAFAALEQ